MDGYYFNLEKLFSKGDPLVTSWFLVRDKYLPFLLSVLYVLISTVIGPAVMKHRKPYDLRNCMIVFNFSLVIIYTVWLSIFIWLLQYSKFQYFCEENVARKGHVIYTFASLCWVQYVIKYVEFLDTIFFVLRKKQKQISLLHVTHHAILPLLIWLCMRTQLAVFQIFPLALNSIVHVVMYSYYGLSAMGPSIRKHLWWKKYLTQLQIIQFILIITLTTVVAPLTGCKIGVFTYVTNIIFVPVIFFQFYLFYKENYIIKKTTNEAKLVCNKTENEEKYLNSLSSHNGDSLSNGLKKEK